jgi:hypothetical protein
MGLVILSVTLAMISTLNSLLLVGESQTVESNESLLTYNDTAYGISIQYPSDWQIDQSAHEYLLAILQNLTSESQMTNDSQNNAIKSQVSNILNAFGLESVSDIAGLSPDKRTELFQEISQSFSQGNIQMIVTIISPPEDESDATVESMNIVAENISAFLPMSLDDYMNASIEGLKTVFQDFTVAQAPTEITVNGKPAMTLVYTGRLGDVPITGQNLVLLTIDGDTGYSITFGAVPETYPVYEPTFQKMFNSFKIND